MKRVVLLVPFLLTLAAVLQLGYIASIVVSPGQILRPLVILWLILALLIWPAYRLTRDWVWTALLLSVFVLGLYFSPEFFSSIFLFIALVSVCWVVYARLRRVRIQAHHGLGILAVTAVFFTVYGLYLMAAMLSRIPWEGYRRAVEAAENYSPETFSSPASKPDIYYIILDGYARSDILQELYNFDNSDFTAYLQEAGFVVPASNHNNYPATPQSIASTLNMDYIQALVPALDEQYQRWLMEPLIDHSRVRTMLESQGYQTVSISTNWTITENDTTDIYLHPFPVMLTDFEGFILDSTPLRLFDPLLGDFSSHPTADTHREIIRYNFESLAGLAEQPGPKFVVAHLISPHPPFVFDRHGNPVEFEGPMSFQDANEFSVSRQEYAQKYVEQLLFVNDNLRKTIDHLLARSSTPPIILLQADHGSGLLTDLGSAENTCIRERFSPFAAYHLPGVDNAVVPADVSAVNLFRIVFNEYFDAQLPLLEARQYYYQDMQNYYQFVDVTGRYNDPCTLPKE